MTLCIPLIHDNGNTIIMDIREILRGFSKIQVDFQKWWPQKNKTQTAYLNDLQRWSSNSQYPSRTVSLKSSIRQASKFCKTIEKPWTRNHWFSSEFAQTLIGPTSELREPIFMFFFFKKSLRFFSLDCACFYSDWGTLRKPVDMPTV